MQAVFWVSLFGFLTMLVKVLWTDPRDRRWAKTDASLKDKNSDIRASDIKHSSSEDAAVLAQKIDATRKIDETVNMRVTELARAMEAFNARLDTLAEAQAHRREVVAAELRAAATKKDSPTTKGTP